jgi:predicted deacetylase
MADMPDLAKVATALGQLDEKATDLRTMKMWLARHGRIAEVVTTNTAGTSADHATVDDYRATVAALVGDGIECGREQTATGGYVFRIAEFGKYATLIVRGPA